MEINFKTIYAVSLFFILILLFPGSYSQGGEKRIISIDDAVAIAMSENFDIKAAKARIEASRAAIKEAESAFFPSLSLKENFLRTNNPPLAFFNILAQRQLNIKMPSASSSSANPFSSFNEPDPVNNWSTKFSVEFPIFTGGKRIAEKKAADSMAEADEADLERVRNNIACEVKSTFLNILKAEEMVKVSEEYIKMLRSQREVAESKYEAGKILLSDVLSVKVRLAEAEEGLLIARNNVRKAKNLFNVALGQNISEEFELKPAAISDTVSFLTADTANRLVSLKETALKKRPEVKKIEEEIKSSEYNVKSAMAEYFPTIGTFFNYEIDGKNPEVGRTSWIAGAGLEFYLFEGFKTSSRVGKRKAEVSEMSAKRRKLMLEIEREVDDAYNNKIEAEKRVGVLRDSVFQAEENLRIYEDRYKEGLVIISDVLSAQVSLTNTRLHYKIAQYDNEISLKELEYACGGTLLE